MVFKRSHTQKDAYELINQKLFDKPDFKPLNKVNVCKHFNLHAPTKAKTAMALTKAVSTHAIMGKRTMASPELVKMVTEKVNQDVGDFNDLSSIRDKLLDKLQSLDNHITNTGEDGQMDRWAVQLYSTLAAEIRACVVDLNKMRQSERLMKSVVQTLLDKLMLGVTPLLLDEYDVIINALRDKGIDTGFVDMIDERLRTRTAKIMTDTARMAVMEVSKQFKIS
jgi:hypothetical protein